MTHHRFLTTFALGSVLALLAVLGLLAAATATATAAHASSHREAPFVTENPKVDGTDFYMFRSYESGREGFVTLLANYLPLQDSYGAPNYFDLDPQARYAIHIDNTGDGVEDITFGFAISLDLQDIQIPVGAESVSIPLVQVGPIDVDPASFQNVRRTYRMQRIDGPIDSPISSAPISEVGTGKKKLDMPYDYIGTKTFVDYETYADGFVTDISIPGCADGRAFVGQRKESFAVNLGEIFDLVNIENPVGDANAEPSVTEYKNITTFAVEVPIDCLTGGTGTDIIGGWTAAYLPRNRELNPNPTYDVPEIGSGGLVRVSRLGMPLVNEAVIGVKDKNLFNSSRPDGDLQFATYVTNPTLPELLEILFATPAPNNFPRLDLLATFVTGIPGLNEFGFGEMQRLNVTIPPTPKGAQDRLGVLGGDAAGFPNGRRPGDDVVDLTLQVAMGILCHTFPGVFGCDGSDAGAGLLPFTDGTLQDPSQFDEAFPYLTTPIPGSPNGPNGVF